MISRAIIHLCLHAIVPLLLARSAYAKAWQRAFVVMMATMVVDLDHLLSSTVYDPNRCSLGFHPLHTAGPIAVYGLLCLWPRTRWVGLGLVIHMLLDGLDCVWMRLSL